MDSKQEILSVTEGLIQLRGVSGTTLADIASGANCAKGLINYHFGSKNDLIGIIAERVVQTRIDSWQTALESGSPNEAIDKSWKLLCAEARDGTLKIWDETIDRNWTLTEQTVKTKHEAFNQELGRISSATLGRAHLRARIPMSELGNLLAAVVHGIGRMLLAGMNQGELEGAYAAAWLGILSFTQE
jgi:AcrR family transcriptional regulator